MIQLKTMLNCIDNSGATIVECIAKLRMKKHAKVGDRIIVVVQKARSMGESSPGAGGITTNKVRRGDIRHAVVVRTLKKLQRKDGMVVRFDDNACALIGKGGEPIGTKINGVVGSELRDKKWSKILSLAPLHSDSGLPPLWEVRHSNSKNLPYFFNTETKESRWEAPEGVDLDRLKAYMAESARKPGKIRAAHLLVKHRGSRRPSSWKEQNITRSKEEAIHILRDYERRIQSGEVSLGDLAVTESDCSSAKKNGDLGFFGKGEMQREFEEVAFGLEPGQISNVVDTASGIHLIQRLE
ncbi:MAG: hypothetical protein LQ342_007219 [Letrouitia transgressa]|nr:MAG: hypothetical protein LQ342_007219 [Letrouitia transgressa]